MPVVRGESLRNRLDREKQLPITDAVRVAGEVAGTLDYAHREGIVHRDIKPENVLLQDGHALVADFGIGKALSAAEGPSLTKTGIGVGTSTYMSPEQAVGETVDGRSDLYSLGCVLYEILVREGVPRPVARALQRSLARTPIDRPSTGAEILAMLREVEPAVAVSQNAAPAQSIAVLPYAARRPRACRSGARRTRGASGHRASFVLLARDLGTLPRQGG
jgi:serine/threonine-protein kinase